MDISSINNQLSQFISGSVKADNDQKNFESAIKEAMEKKDEEKLKTACQEFEAYFVQQLFKEMRKTVPEGTLLEKSAGRDIFEDMLDEEYSKNISKGNGIGLANMLYKQLSK